MRDEHPNEQLKIELLRQWKLEAEFRNNEQRLHAPVCMRTRIKTRQSISVLNCFLKMYCVQYYLFRLQLKALLQNLVYLHLDEHFQVHRLLIKY